MKKVVRKESAPRKELAPNAMVKESQLLKNRKSLKRKIANPIKAKTLKQIAAERQQKIGVKDDEERLAEEERKETMKVKRYSYLNDFLKFKNFLNCSFKPIISDVEITVAFVDIRGFTAFCKKLQQEMQDKKIQNFLKQHSKIYNEALVRWFIENCDPDYKPVEAKTIALSSYVIPTMYKNLGDGLMLVWEIPEHLDIKQQGLLTQNIYDIILNIFARFHFHFRKLSRTEVDAYTREVLNLKIGCGLAKGHAWKLDYGNSVDYAGSILNLASRLQDYARPEGIVSQYDTSTTLFDHFAFKDKGRILELKGIKGYESNIKVHVTAEVIIPEENLK